MYWHVQHDDHVFGGEQLIVLANDEKHAAQIVAFHNAEIDKVVSRLRYLLSHYQSQSAHDAGRRQIIEDTLAFIGHEKRTDQADLQIALDCLTSYLLDHTDNVFEEDQEIDDARSAIQQRIEQHEEEKSQ